MVDGGREWTRPAGSRCRKEEGELADVSGIGKVREGIERGTDSEKRGLDTVLRFSALPPFPSTRKTRKIATRRSFNTLDTWHDEFLNQAGPSDPQRFPFILVGNKIDLDGGSKRMVLEKKVREWCASKGDIPYFETSAKEDHNIDTAFLCIARLALEHEHDQDM
uniref:Ras-related protein Rab7 n=1 Tax=Zea mays TaxID=4577 RepID=A0A804PY63_MAIZE